MMKPPGNMANYWNLYAKKDHTHTGYATSNHKHTDYVATSMLLENKGNYTGIPTVRDDGVMEIGRYLDWHAKGSTADYDVRMELSGSRILSGGNIIVTAKKIGDYYGWSLGGEDNGWLRTPQTGLLPYASGTTTEGKSAIGTDSWRFQNGYFVNLFAKKIEFANDDNITYDDSANKWSVKSDSALANSIWQVGKNYTFCGGECYKLMADNADHLYMSLYPRQGNYNLRGGYIGYGSNGATALTINSQIGGLDFRSSGNISANGNGCSNFALTGKAEWAEVTFFPDADNKGNLGTNNNTWNTLKCTNQYSIGTLNKSKSHNITPFGDKEYLFNTFKNLNIYLMNTRKVDYFEERFNEEGMPYTVEFDVPIVEDCSEIKLTCNAEELPMILAPKNIEGDDGNHSVELGAMITGLSGAFSYACEKIESLEDRMSRLEDIINGIEIK